MDANLLKKILEDDTINAEDVRELYEIMQKKKILASYTFPTKPSSDGYYHIHVKDESRKSGRRSIKRKTIGELQDAVYALEKGEKSSVPKTFKYVFESALEERMKYIKNPEKKLSAQNTEVKERNEFKRFFQDTPFASRRIEDINSRDIENICFDILERIELRPKGFANLRSILSKTFKYAYYEGWIKENPYTRVNFQKFKDMLVEATPIEKRSYSEDEIDRMLQYIHEYQSKRPDYLPAYALELQMLCGLRRGEVPPLEWADLHDGQYLEINKEQITVRKIKEDVIVNHTKTHKNRWFPITSDIQEFLVRLKAVHQKYNLRSNRLFPDSTTETGTIASHKIYGCFHTMCKHLGIPLSQDAMKGMHAFRRVGITKVANSKDGNIIMASKLFGNSPQVAMKHYYTGVDMDSARKILEGNQGNQLGNQKVKGEPPETAASQGF